VVFQDGPESVRQRRDLAGPGEGGIGRAVDLGQHPVEDEVLKLLLAADMAVQRAGNHAEAAGEGAHAEGLDAIRTDDREGLGYDTFAGERAAVVARAVRRVEPQRVGPTIDAACLPSLRHVFLRASRLTVNDVYYIVNSVARKQIVFTRAVFFRGAG
jgi:hypothetical protein